VRREPLGAAVTDPPYGIEIVTIRARNETIDDSLYVYDPTIGDGDLYAVTPLVDNPTIFDVRICSAMADAK
jgi:hypothetical protein